MGITAKPVSKMQSIMRKMENQLEAEKKAAKEKREAKKNKKSWKIRWFLLAIMWDTQEIIPRYERRAVLIKCTWIYK